MLLSNYCFCSGSIPEHVRFCVHPLRVDSVFFTALWLSKSKPHWPSKPNTLGACLPSTGPLGWRARHEGQTPRYLGRTSAIVIIFPLVGSVWVLTIPCLHPSYVSYGFFFLSLVAENPLVFRSFSLLVAL